MPSPSVSKAIRYVEPLILDSVKGASAAYSLRKLSKLATKAIRVRRSDDNSESDIGFSGKHLDIAALKLFLERELLTSPLGVDGDSNGVSDNYTSYSGVTTTAFSVSGGEQIITITNANVTNQSSTVESAFLPVNATESFYTSVLFRKTGDVKSRFYVNYFDVAYGYVGTNATIHESTSETDVLLEITGTAPANTKYIQIGFGGRATSIGGNGVVYYKSGTAKKTNLSAHVTTWYDQSGNGRNAVQATAGNQALIANNSATVTVNNRPSLMFPFVANSCAYITSATTKQQQSVFVSQYASGTNIGAIASAQGLCSIGTSIAGLLLYNTSHSIWYTGTGVFRSDVRKNGANGVNLDNVAVYSFSIGANSITAGTVYTNNGQTFTVVYSTSSSGVLTCTGTGAPSASGTLTYVSGSPTGNLTFSASIGGSLALPMPLSVFSASASSQTNAYAICLGNDRNNSNRGWSGYIPEFIVFSVTQDISITNKIEKSQAKYYGITLV